MSRHAVQEVAHVDYTTVSRERSSVREGHYWNGDPFLRGSAELSMPFVCGTENHAEFIALRRSCSLDFQ